MTQCCGTDHTTAFCPHCGTQLERATPLLSLLAHCERTASHHDKMHQHSVDNYQNEPNAFYAKNVRTHQEAKQEWRSWSDALRDLMHDSAGLQTEIDSLKEALTRCRDDARERGLTLRKFSLTCGVSPTKVSDWTGSFPATQPDFAFMDKEISND